MEMEDCAFHTQRLAVRFALSYIPIYGKLCAAVWRVDCPRNLIYASTRPATSGSWGFTALVKIFLKESTC